MLDHLTLPVTDYERSKAFYLAALAPLGYQLVMELSREQIPDLPVPRTCGIGPGRPILWLRPAKDVTPTHVAFGADRRALVDDFHRAALAAGATDHGAPGPRPHYHSGYYGAFVLDPDGYNLEAVCHHPDA
jgi:catechol 2,3-dioxygenase-like lactoylglutathione lyase family enzyme